MLISMQKNVKRKHRKVGHAYRSRAKSKLMKRARARMKSNRRRR